jgi:hypothetical protein
MADGFEDNDAGEVEPPPEAVGFKQVDTHGFTNPTLWRYGIEDLERLPFAGPGLWRQIGPAPLLIGNDQIFQGIGPDAGVVYDIAIDPSGGDTQIIYIATANGGVWKTTNGGASWQPMSDFIPSSAVGAVAIDPGDPNTVYAGTGNLFEASGVPKSTGLFKSLDGGSTWAHMDGGLHATVFANNGINRIVCPSPNTVLVATDIGLFFSKDGGLNFGANELDFNDGHPIRSGFISALARDNGAITVRRVTDVSTTTPIVVTAANHGVQKDDRAYIGGVVPARNVNGSWIVDPIDDNTFSLRNSLAGGAAGATSGFVMGPAHPNTRIVQSADNVAPGNRIVIRADGHGFLTGDIVAIHGVGGNTAANGSWPIRVRDADHFELEGSRGNAAYTAGGIVDGPRHVAPAAITVAANQGTAVRVTVPAHGFVEGDQVTVTGLPGVAANTSAFVIPIDNDNFSLGGMQLNAAYAGGGTVVGPSTAWNSVYFVSAGPTGAARGLFRCTLCSDGGIVLSDNLMGHAGGPPLFGRVAFTQSLLPRSRTLYIAVQNDTGTRARFLGFFRSDNFGRTWIRRTGATSLDNQVSKDGVKSSQFDFTIGVDPQDSARVYAGLQQLWRSTNSGAQWNNVVPITLGGNQADALIPNAFTARGHSPSTCLLHWDHHALVFAPPTWWAWNVGPPSPPSAAYFGTDGGISRTDDGGNTYVSLNEGLATALLEDMDIGHGAGNNIITFGGMQDLGTAGHRSGDAELTWVAGVNSDGDYTAIDPAAPNTVWGFEGNLLTWTPNGGVTWFTETLAHRPIITEVHNTNPVEVVTTGHPFQTGDQVTIAGVPGGGGLANGTFTITRVDNFIFQLNGRNGQAAPAFTPGPLVTGGRCLVSRHITAVTATAPIEIETSVAHGLSTGDQVHIEGVLGRTVVNNTGGTPFWTVTRISDTRFSLDGSDATVSPNYVSGTGRMRGPRRLDGVPIQLVTNATPIVVTATNHGLVSGDTVTVQNVLGTTNANTGGANPATWTITVIDSNSIILQGSAGANTPAFIQGPRASGQSVGRGLGATADRHRVAVEPDGANPANVVFVSRAGRLLRSANGGASFTAVAGMPPNITEISALTASRVDQLWVGTVQTPQTNAVAFRPGRVFFRGAIPPGPVHFFGAAENFISDVGARGNIAAIAVDPRDNQHVAVVASGYSETSTRRRTRHCFVSTTGGRAVGGARAWTEVGGVFDAPVGNLPDFPMLSLAWDNSTNPSTLLVASDGGILRLNGNQWERVGPNLPNVSCQALRIDTSVVPPVIRVGTYGRSAWEWVLPTGPKLVARAQLGFGERRVGTDNRLPLALHNVGDAPLAITNMDPIGDFSFDPAPAFPLNIPAGGRHLLSVLFHPSTAGPRAAILQIISNDPEPLLQLRPTGIGVTFGRGRLSVRSRVDFGFVATGAAVTIPLEIANTGLDTINVTTLALAAGGNAAFSLPAPPALPLVLAPGDVQSVDIQFAPTAAGAINRNLNVATNGNAITVVLNGAGAAPGSANLIASIIHFFGLGDDDGEQGAEVLV